MKKFLNLAIAAVAVAALPHAAQAGTSTATGTATVNVIDQCSVAPKNIDLGIFSVDDTWSTVGKSLGYLDNVTLYFRGGSKGLTYVDYGTINCSAGTIFQLSIKGTGPNGTVKLKIGPATGLFAPFLKTFDGEAVLDGFDAPAGGGVRIHMSTFLQKANGSNQTLHGHMPTLFNGDLPIPTEKLVEGGTFTDTLTYKYYF